MAYKKYDSPAETDKNSFNIDYYKDPCYHGVIEVNEKSTEPVTLSEIRDGSYETGDKLISENHVSPSGFFVGKGSIIFY